MWWGHPLNPSFSLSTTLTLFDRSILALYLDGHPAVPLVVSVTVSRKPNSSSFLSFLFSFFPPPLPLETGYLRLASNLIEN